jgi:DNA-directed RNA polymerase specialized sigma24 family protein
MVAEQNPDPTFLDALAERAAAGDREALSQWVEQLWPFLVKLVRSNSSMRPLAASDDHVHNVVQRAIEKISAGVGSYVRWKGAHPEKAIFDWIRIVTKNAMRDYVRAQLGPRLPSDQPSVKRLLNEFSSSEQLDERGHRPPFTAAQTARELFEFAQRHLTPPQLGALSRWLEGQSFDEIAGQLGIASDAAAPLLHAGIAVLRRHFREDSPA